MTVNKEYIEPCITVVSSGTKITLTELLVAILMCIFSWITFLILIVIIYGDKTVFEKK